ncbi:hypothetical protein DID78_06995 [Candidatus Marinamargulisbacteria bacterium SCGC AG-343-D04]|nr:hypothetical protein DID78_06995 [Candidatus Marinamargulisbacteria bacterium SCGC AG-343-D04]
MGLATKLCFETIESLYPHLRHINTHLYTKTQEGVPLHHSMQSLFNSSKIATKFSIQSVNISSWISYKYDYEKQSSSLLTHYWRIIQKPLCLIALSSILNAGLLFIFVPKVHKLFTELNQSPPFIITFILHIKTLLATYSHSIVISLLLLGVLSSKWIKSRIVKMLKRYLYPLFLHKLCMEISLYLQQHIDIKSIIESIQVNKNSLYKTSLHTFKNIAINNHKLKEGFFSLLPTHSEQHIITHAIASNQLHKGLHYIAKIHKDNFFDSLKQSLSRLSLCLLILTGITILTGFYLTLLPLQYLVKNL